MSTSPAALLELGDSNLADHPTINSTAAQTVGMDLGMNLDDFAYYMRSIPYTNVLKQADFWITQNKGNLSTRFDELNTNELDHFLFDADGYPSQGVPVQLAGRQIVPTTRTLYGTKTGSLSSDPTYPGGWYVILFRGRGTLSARGDVVETVSAQACPSRSGYFAQAVRVVPGNLGIVLTIESSDPQPNHVRDIQVIPLREMDLAKCEAKSKWNPQFIDFMKGLKLKTLRFMRWAFVINSQATEWDDVTPSSFYSYAAANGSQNAINRFGRAGTGVPYADQLELASLLSTTERPVSAWIHIPPRAIQFVGFTPQSYLSDFPIKFAQNLKVYLSQNPSVKVYVEYGNELWNSAFSNQYGFYSSIDLKRISDNKPYPYARKIGKIITEQFKILKSILGTSLQDRMIAVIGTHNARALNGGYGQHVLGEAVSPNWNQPENCVANPGLCDVFSPAAYTCTKLGQDPQALDIYQLKMDQIMDRNQFFTRANATIDSDPVWNLKNILIPNVTLATRNNLELELYEFGQSCVGIGAWSTDAVTDRNANGIADREELKNVFTAANRAPEMMVHYQMFFDMLNSIGIRSGNAYQLASPYNLQGSWGLFPPEGMLWEYTLPSTLTAPKAAAFLERAN